MNWHITHNPSGYRIIDDKGRERGRYRSASELATHLAIALRELDALRRQKATDRFLAHLGKEHLNVRP